MEPSPRLMRCNSSASTEAEMLFQGLLPHTHSPTGSSFRSLFPTPSGLHSRFQIPYEMALYQGKGRAQGREAGPWLAHQAGTTSPREGREGKKGEERTFQQLQCLEEISRDARATGRPSTSANLLQEQTRQSTRCIQRLKCCLC